MSAKPLLWSPAIYEHKAALVGRDVAEVAFSADLLAEASLAEYETYRTDYLTAGVDVYNVEAEACGAVVKATGAKTCPEIIDRLYDIDALPEQLLLPDVDQAGRFAMLLEAGQQVHAKIGEVCGVFVPASGPASIAAKMVGLQNLIMAMAFESESAARLLEFCTKLAEAWCARIRQAGLDVIVFDSVVAPPMISPQMYVRWVQPLHARLGALLESSGQSVRPLIVGGDTTALAVPLVETGANMLICDFPAEAAQFAAALPEGADVQIRRNVNPQVLAGSDEQLARAGLELAKDMTHFARPIAGTGILPYDANPAAFAKLREATEFHIQ